LFEGWHCAPPFLRAEHHPASQTEFAGYLGNATYLTFRGRYEPRWNLVVDRWHERASQRVERRPLRRGTSPERLVQLRFMLRVEK
jgi:hypothetical protein